MNYAAKRAELSKQNRSSDFSQNKYWKNQWASNAKIAVRVITDSSKSPKCRKTDLCDFCILTLNSLTLTTGQIFSEHWNFRVLGSDFFVYLKILNMRSVRFCVNLYYQAVLESVWWFVKLQTNNSFNYSCFLASLFCVLQEQPGLNSWKLCCVRRLP